ncbi:hypothetical protein F5Y12DRAFT_763183 [Xylaria sp. FL1777]|nr:hypothetical protein F5Y12DRAFT_763183 [Xylaria sp. FL1777]
MHSFSSPQALKSIAGIVFLYLISVAFYRLFLHLLAQFPGPKFGAVTPYYEAYYDMVKKGRYRSCIAEMHETYV